MPSAQAGVARLKSDAETSFLIQPDIGVICDVSGRIPADKIKIVGVEIEDDPDFGEVMVPQGGNCGVTVPDAGKISFKGGVTLEAWVWLKPKRNTDDSLAYKEGRYWQRRSFATSVSKSGRFNLGHYGTKAEPIDFTQDEKPHNWGFRPDNLYGGTQSGTHGNLPIAEGVWTHVAWTYDEKRALVRTWVNGVLDREFYEREPMISHEMVDMDDAPVELFRKASGIKIAQVRLSQGARIIGYVPPVKVYIHESPYWKKGGYVHVKPNPESLALPAELEVLNISGGFAAANRVTLKSLTDPVSVAIPKFEYGNVRSTLVVLLKRNGREIWRQEAVIGNPELVSPEMIDFYAGRTSYPAKLTKPDWNIGEDNTFYYKGKPILPLKLYFASPENFDLVSGLGFNMIGFRNVKGKTRAENEKAFAPCFEKAEKLGITIVVDRDDADRPAQGFLAAFDEPFNYSWDLIRQRYLDLRATRSRRATLPVHASQNNQTRYRETSMCCDVLAPDPYNKGRSPMRSIYDAIRGAVLQVDDRKPVMCIVANYGTDKFRPDPEELRTMCYLSFEAGARSLGFYSWDEGEEPGGPMDTTCKPNQIEAYRKLFKEFRELDAALTVPNAKEAVRIEPAQPRGFFPCVKKGRDFKTYLIVSSDLYRSTAKTVVMPSAANRKAKLLFGPWREGMKLAASKELAFDAEGKASLSLPPVSSAVYVLEAKEE